MLIPYKILNKSKTKQQKVDVQIDLFNLASDLYKELENLNVISRMKETPQLGVIKVAQKINKSRYDYIMLQLYLHQIIRHNLNKQIEYSYGNIVKDEHLGKNIKYQRHDVEPSIADLLQILIFAYNIGHYKNTFTASRAAVIYATQNDIFKNMIFDASSDNNYKKCANILLDNEKYIRFHLLNSLIILNKLINF